MKTLYLKLIELLEEIPEIKYVDLNCGQLQMEKPPLAYPAVLIKMNSRIIDNVQDLFQIKGGDFELLLCAKMLSESNSLAPEEVREKSLDYFDLSDKIYKKIQGYEDSTFDAFAWKNANDQSLRKGLKTVAQTFETSWREEIANS